MEGRSRRERVRLDAAAMFVRDVDARQIASSLRSARSRSTSGGAPGSPVARRRPAARRAGGRPAADGWGQDQRWTLARVAALIERLSGVSYTLRGVSFLLQRLGFSPQVSAHRAFERDEDTVAEWRSATWAKVRG